MKPNRAKGWYYLDLPLEKIEVFSLCVLFIGFLVEKRNEILLSAKIKFLRERKKVNKTETNGKN